MASDLLNCLLQLGAAVCGADPQALPMSRRYLSENVRYGRNPTVSCHKLSRQTTTTAANIHGIVDLA